MAEVIIKEKITNKAWPATIIDLAVRGYVRIKEDKPYWPNVIRYFIPKNYIIEKIRLFSANDSSLEGYEKRFSQIIFREKDYFSTKELKKAGKDNRLNFYKAIKVLERALCREIESDTNAFEKLISDEYRRKWFYFGGPIIIFILFYLSGFVSADFKQYYITLLVGIVSAIGLYAFIKYEARLSKEGVILKEEWLGFKLYLETAEKYRLQNLTPETFEKYFPYAMIFGVEKQWAKTFESINIKSPSWYGDSSIGGGNISDGGINSGGGFYNFSSSAFSTSFNSSFASAFSSASGVSLGGSGGAGGGGCGGSSGAD